MAYYIGYGLVFSPCLMSLENLEKLNKDERPLPMIITGLDNDGMPIYSEMTSPIPNIAPETPVELFDAITKELDSFIGNNEQLVFGRGEFIELAINSNHKIRYQILDAKNGHYLVGRGDYSPEDMKEVSSFMSSRNYGTKENPDLAILSAQKLEQMMRES